MSYLRSISLCKVANASMIFRYCITSSRKQYTLLPKADLISHVNSFVNLSTLSSFFFRAVLFAGTFSLSRNRLFHFTTELLPVQGLLDYNCFVSASVFFLLFSLFKSIPQVLQNFFARIIQPSFKEESGGSTSEMPPKSAKKRETTEDGGFQLFIPPAVRAVMNQPPPTQTNSTHRHLLLPYLALGFAPTPTSGASHECGLRALCRAYRDARDALRAPGTPKIKHATLVDFRNLLDSEVYRDIVTEQLINYGIFSLDEDDPVRRENMANAWRKTDLDITNLVQLLEAANK